MKFIIQSWEAYVSNKKPVLPENVYERILSFDEETVNDWIKKYALNQNSKEILQVIKELGNTGYFDDAVDLAYDEIEIVVVNFLQQQKRKNENA
jgi:hypothetical protein